MGTNSSDMTHQPTNESIQPPPDPFVPFESLTEPVIRSIISVVTSPPWDAFNHSERSLLMFLLAIKKKVDAIENSCTTEKNYDEVMLEHAKKVRQWLVYSNGTPLKWEELENIYKHAIQEKQIRLAKYFHSADAEPYCELRFKSVSYR